MEIQNTNTSTAFLKKGKYLDKEKFLVNLSDLMSEFIFSELKIFFATPFSKRLINKYSLYIPLSFRGIYYTNEAPDLPLPSFRKSIYRTLHYEVHMLLSFMCIMP